MIGGICPRGHITSPGVGFHWSRDFPSPRFSSPFSTGLDIFVYIIRQICFQLFLRVYAFHPFYCYLDWCFMGYIFYRRPPHLERCQCLLLSPLRILSVPSAGVTKYGPALSWGKQDLLLGFLPRTLLPHHFICCEVLISWCYSDVQWNIGLLENIGRLWRRLQKLLCGFRTIIVTATISWSDFSPESSLTSQPCHPVPPVTPCGFHFHQSPSHYLISSSSFVCVHRKSWDLVCLI